MTTTPKPATVRRVSGRQHGYLRAECKAHLWTGRPHDTREAAQAQADQHNAQQH